MKLKSLGKQKNWHIMSRQQALESLRSRSGGLTSEEVEERIRKYGLNELPTDPPLSGLIILLNQFRSPLVYVLLVAGAISFFIGEIFDLIVIIASVLINTLIGFWQEYKADQTISKLKKLVEYHVTVIRDGREQLIAARDVVVGDILMLEAGDKVSADGRLLQENNLQVNEASLTGESFPVEKHTEPIQKDVAVGDRLNMIFLGTTITRGRAKAVVTATGINTQIGQIARLVKETKEEKTPLQMQIRNISKFLTMFVIIAVSFVVIIGQMRGQSLEELFITAAALAVAAIPEGLLVALTLVLVFGMQKILKKKALIRQLMAAETLGSVSIVCADKTGTITEGDMQVDKLLVGGELHSTKESNLEAMHLFALKAVALCNNAYIKNPNDKLKEWQLVGDTTDAALLKAAAHAGFDKEKLNKEYARLDELSFSEVYKYMATMHYVADDGVQVFVKGAPESVLPMCTHLMQKSRNAKLNAKSRKVIEDEYHELTSQGLRVLAIAYQKHPKKTQSFDQLVKDREDPKLKNLVFVGWVGLIDPVRQEAPAAFASMQDAGIRTVIITGDHKYTVKAIVRELGMDVPDSRILEGVDLDKMDDEALFNTVKNIDIYARVEPKHKLRIVQAWKRHDEVVAMLGDGVNDTPALKAADIGIAVGSATDVAKETSDMILLDGNFSVIEGAVREGRVIFDNIRKIFLYLVADSFTEIILITLALFFGYPLPLAAVHILWINIISDGLPDLALSKEPAENDVMNYPPRPKAESVINSEVKMLIAAITTVAVITMFSLYIFLINTSGDIVYTRTVVFSAFAIDSIIYIFAIKSLRLPFWRIKLLSNPYLVAVALLAISAQFLVVYLPVLQKLFDTVPLGASEWVLIFALGFIEILVIEIIKRFYWHGAKFKAA